MSKKRILLVCDQKNWGGWVRGEYIQKHLSDEFEIDLVDSNEFSEYERLTNKNIFTFGDLEKFKGKSNDKEVFIFESFKKFISKNRENIKYDLVYLLFHTMLVTKKVKRMSKTGVKMITIVTGLPVIKPIFRHRNCRENNFKELSSMCRAIGANNYFSLNELKEEYDGKTFYAPRGVDENMFYLLSKNPKNKNEKLVVAYVGKPVEEKGLPIIKEVCNTAGVKLITNTRNFTNALSQDEMREFYNKADVYMVASTIDGSPNPMLEAAACGKPIIANHIGNSPEFVKNHYNGFLLRKEHGRKINKYVYWLKHLNQNREKCFEMGMNARKEVLENWTWGKVLNNERKIFREVLDE